ncbi:hypothetical protein KVT40_008906 [Elsinoe batatas]|uniref:Global transcription regulator sge1 n=1 Tax=Elsinoe batatas TaxID=2601811 RepID=A0A8K0KV97_9PEZI|nr:hypothetical protein KVT40_008906 [Elsinoe batatas]
MSGSGSGPLVPTFSGFVQNSMDGLVLFEACLSGKLHHVPRRPHDRERANLIKSGSIFIYEENASGIKRWTDGVAWSPSRILGNFLIYRELEKPFPPGEKKRAMKRKRSSQIGDPSNPRTSEDRDRAEVSMPPTPPSPKPMQTPTGDSTTQESEREMDRQLIGSLVDSYGFRPDGLVKKTMSVAINGVSHHLVSYYKVGDVKSGRLSRPLEDARLASLTIRPELYLKQNFRTPVEDTEHYVVDPSNMHAHPGQTAYPSMMPQYAMRPGTQYIPGYPAMYNVPASQPGMYQPGLPPAHSYPQQYPDYYQQKHQYNNSTPTSAGAHSAGAPSYQHASSATPHHAPPAQSPYTGSAATHHGTNSPAQHIPSASAHHTSHQNNYHASSPHQQAAAGSPDGVNSSMQHVGSGSYDMYDRRTTSGYGATGTTYAQTGPSSYTTSHGGPARMW